jgi:recombinational DNA repair protein RecR
MPRLKKKFSKVKVKINDCKEFGEATSASVCNACMIMKNIR